MAGHRRRFRHGPNRWGAARHRSDRRDVRRRGSGDRTSRRRAGEVGLVGGRGRFAQGRTTARCRRAARRGHCDAVVVGERRPGSLVALVSRVGSASGSRPPGVFGGDSAVEPVRGAGRATSARRLGCRERGSNHWLGIHCSIEWSVPSRALEAGFACGLVGSVLQRPALPCGGDASRVVRSRHARPLPAHQRIDAHAQPAVTAQGERQGDRGAVLVRLPWGMPSSWSRRDQPGPLPGAVHLRSRPALPRHTGVTRSGDSAAYGSGRAAGARAAPPWDVEAGSLFGFVAVGERGRRGLNPEALGVRLHPSDLDVPIASSWPWEHQVVSRSRTRRWATRVALAFAAFVWVDCFAVCGLMLLFPIDIDGGPPTFAERAAGCISLAIAVAGPGFGGWFLLRRRTAIREVDSIAL